MAKKTLGSLIPELLVQLTADPPHRVGILGSTSFFHPSTESICTALGQQLAQQSQVTLLTGGMPGVAEAVARNFHQFYRGTAIGGTAPIYQLLPTGFEPGAFGKRLVAGQTLEQRRWLLAQLAPVYVVLEGGPGTAQEVKWAIQAGAIVIPVACTGGFAAQLYAAVNRKLAQYERESDTPEGVALRHRPAQLSPTVRHALNYPQPWHALAQYPDVAALIDALMRLLPDAWNADDSTAPVQFESPSASLQSSAVAPVNSLNPSETSTLMLKGHDFRGQPLEGRDFRGYRLINVNFEGANLKGANFIGAELINVCFNQAVLTEADFYKAKLHRVQGIGMQAPYADFTGVQFYGVNFSQADLYAASFNQVKTHPADATVLSEAEIEEDVRLREAEDWPYSLILHEAQILLIKAQNASFDRVWLSKAQAEFADFGGSLWTGSMLHHVNLEYADLRDATLRGCQLQSAIAHCSNWSQSHLIHCNFEDMDAQESIWTDARFEDCKLSAQQVQIIQDCQEKKPPFDHLGHQTLGDDTDSAQADGSLALWRDRPSPMSSSATILIVDDSITVRELLTMSFEKGGYRVASARDGQDAWDQLKAGLHCDVIFCDIEMPRMDGFELLTRLKQDPQLQSIPVAILTSRGIERWRRPPLWQTWGVAAYFTKPYDREILLAAIVRLLQGETLWTSGTESSTEFMAQTQSDHR
ncbi:MAG: pentapeptide repeat-containing protein [Leptolyngbyaceae cyanobacterium]